MSISAEQKRKIVESEITRAVSKGARVELQTDETAVVVFGHRVNHVLHLILTLVTAGLWAIVWIIGALAGGERRQTLTISDAGKPTWSNPRR
jgi:Na+/H+-translocating membrane pyrophosphatase